MKTARLFITLLAGATILLSGCNNDDNPVTYTVTVTQDANGTAVADATTAEAGATVKLTATANTGYVFSKWTVESGGITIEDETANPATFTMPANAVSIKAEFTAIQYDVYVAGYYNVSTSNNIACYWKNGTRIELDLPQASSLYGRGTSIAVSGSDIYVVGHYWANDTNWVPCYWKNGVHTPLSTIGNARNLTVAASSIVVANGKVYIAGKTADNSTKKAMACYWVDGTRTDLTVPAGAGNSYARSIAVVDDNVYVSGEYYANGKYNACTWTNGGEAVTFPDEFNNSYGYSIAVSDGDIYVSGYYWDTDNYIAPCYWKNGKHYDLEISEKKHGSLQRANSIAISGGKVYIAGQTNNENNEWFACLWVDGVRTDLAVPAGVDSAFGTSLAIAGSNIYVAGKYYDGDTQLPCLWTNNGTAEALDVPATAIEVHANSVVAVAQ